MIKDDHSEMTMQDSPPSYDLATESSVTSGSPALKPSALPPSDAKHPNGPPISSPPYLSAGPSYVQQPLQTPGPVVYHYVNPRTQEHVASLLPPDHPEMVCLQSGVHVNHTHYGLLGILAAVFWFPLGIGLCLLDRRVKCSRCGAVLDDGICG